MSQNLTDGIDNLTLNFALRPEAGARLLGKRVQDLESEVKMKNLSVVSNSL